MARAQYGSRPALSILLASLALGGCSTFGGNVSGSFRCSAPDGICAPSTAIDDGAIAQIEATSSTELLSPAGPYRIDDGDTVPQARTGTMAVASVSSRSHPEAVESFALDIVFPAFTDRRGQSHERRVVRAQMALPGRGDAVDELALRASSQDSGRGLLGAAESAPPVLALLDQSRPAAIRPGSTASEASGGAVSSGAIEAIQAEVETMLDAPRTGPRRTAASFPGVEE